jgi:hypothetical protein
VIDSENFERGWGLWNDGGSDSRRNRSSKYATSGKYSIRIRDNTSTSVMEHDKMEVKQYEKLKLSFTYMTKGMEVNEDFWFQVNDNEKGSDWINVAEWMSVTHFVNKKGNIEEFEIVPNDDFVLSDSFEVRFRCNGSSNSDMVYIDDVVISGWM